MNLSYEQELIVKTNKSKVLVASCAGSGKTLTLTSRCKYLLDQGVDPRKIVLITFTNAAAEEISERLGHPKNVFIGTIHSYANYLLLSKGVETADILSLELFDKLFDRIKNNLDCVKEVEHLLLDEGQDSSAIQFEFILSTVNPKNWMIFADWRQSIYRWNGAHPEYIIDLSRDPEVTTFELSGNYRNGTAILNYAKNIILSAGYIYKDHSEAMRHVTGKVVTGIPYNPEAVAKTLEQIGGNYGEWFILARSNDQVDEISTILKRHKIPCDTFKRAQLDNTELAKKMRENTVKVLTIHTSKGLEANNVIVVGAKFYNLEEKCISYVAATRAKNLLVWLETRGKKTVPYKTTSWET